MLTEYLARIEQLFSEHSKQTAQAEARAQEKEFELQREIDSLEAQARLLQKKVNNALAKGDARTAFSLRVDLEAFPLKIAESRLALVEAQASGMAEISRLSRELHPRIFEIFRQAQSEFSELEQTWLKIAHLNAVSSSSASSAAQLSGSLGQQLQSARNQVTKAKSELNSKYQVVA